MDFSKAFDKVSHSLLIYKLKHYGITGKTNQWIDTFLSDRIQSVVVEGETSTSIPVECGVPQGSVPGPSLFLFYINDMPQGFNHSYESIKEKAYMSLVRPTLEYASAVWDPYQQNDIQIGHGAKTDSKVCY